MYNTIMRKIVLYVPSMTSGGAERVMVNLANELSKDNSLEIYLLTLFEGVNTKKVGKNVNVINSKGMGLLKMCRCLRDLRPDVLLSTSTSNIRAYLIHNFLPKQTLFVTRAPNIYYPWKSRSYNGLKYRLASYLTWRAYQFSDALISNSPDTEKSLREAGITNLIQTIGNPVFYRSEINDNAELPNDIKTPYILYVGSFKNQKRIDLLLEAYQKMSKLLDVNLVIVGDGADNGNNKNKAVTFIEKNNLQNQVFMVGRKSELAGYYKHAKCFVLCSEYEGFGNVIVESLAYGTPVVCFDCPGGPSFILGKNEYGIRVNFGDTDSFAQRVCEIISDKIVFNKERLMERADSFSVESITNQYLMAIKYFYNKKFNTNF